MHEMSLSVSLNIFFSFLLPPWKGYCRKQITERDLFSQCSKQASVVSKYQSVLKIAKYTSNRNKVHIISVIYMNENSILQSIQEKDSYALLILTKKEIAFL
jgi:hypothetical protein